MTPLQRSAQWLGLRAVQWLCSLLVLYAIWNWLLAPNLSPVFFAGPQRTWASVVLFAHDGTLAAMLRTTLLETLAGFGIGTVLGVLIALAIGLLPPFVGKLIEPLVGGVYAMPKFVLAPILFVWLGAGFLPRAYLVTLAVLPVVTIYTVSGIRTVDPDVVRTLRLFGATPIQIGSKLLLPHALIYLMTAIVFVIPHALTVAIGSEILFGASNGIGGTLFTDESMFSPDGALAALAVGTVISAVLIGLSRQVENRLLGPGGQRASLV